MMIYFLLYMALLSCPFSALIGSEEQSAPKSTLEALEVSALPDRWWETISANKDQYESQTQEILNRIESLPNVLSDPNKEVAKGRIAEIRQNFQLYSKILLQKPQPPFSPPPLKETYTINQLIGLNTTLQKETIQYEEKKDERKELLSQNEAQQKNLDRVRIEYQNVPKRSEERIMLGLQILAARPSLASGILKLDLYEKTLENASASLRSLQEEIKIASERLVSDSFEQRQFARQLNAAQEVWEESKRNQEQASLAYESKYSNEQTAEAKNYNQSLWMRLTQINLDALQSRNKFLKAEVLYTLSQVLIQPDKIDPEALKMSLTDWTIALKEMGSALEDWEIQSKKSIERSTQLLTLDNSDPSFKSDNEKKLLKSNLDLGQKNLITIQGLKKEIQESRFLIALLQDKTTNLQEPSVRWLRATIDLLYNSFQFAGRTLNTPLFHIGPYPTTLLTIFQFALIMLLTWWLAKIVTSTLDSVIQNRKGVRKSVIYRIKTLIRYSILFIGLLIALTSIGFDFSNLIIIAGALGVGIGFGLQNIFNNFISGIIILFQSHLKVGDFIVLDNGLKGEIREINVSCTVITANDGVEVIVPNAEMITSRIINWTLRDPYRMIHVPFSVAYGSDLDAVAQAVSEAAKSVPSTLDKIGVQDPQVILARFGDSALEMELVVWLNEKWTRREGTARSMYLWSIEKTLRKIGVEIPFPQREVRMRTPQPTQGEPS